MKQLSKYYRTSYFQKSRLLLPLITNLSFNDLKNNLIETYLFGDYIDENIMDYCLITEFKNEIDLDDEMISNLLCIYNTEDSIIYVFSLEKYKKDIDLFLQGEYSKFKDETVYKIASYFYIFQKDKYGKIIKTKNENLKNKEGYIHIYVFFRPKEFQKDIAEDMVKEYDLFSTIEEALKSIKEMEEIIPIFDINKETLKKKII